MQLNLDNLSTIDLEFEQKFKKTSNFAFQPSLFFYNFNILPFLEDNSHLLKTRGSSHAILDVNPGIISIKIYDYKKMFGWNIFKIVLVCVCSLIYLIVNYVDNQTSIYYLDEIYHHSKILHYRPSAIRFIHLLYLNKLYDSDYIESEYNINKYKNRVFDYEVKVVNADLPWIELKEYRNVYESVHFRDLCVSIFESHIDFNEIMGI